MKTNQKQLRTWLVLAFFLFVSKCLAQTSDPALAQEIQAARIRLQAEQRNLSLPELDRQSEILGRSNYVSKAVVNAFARNDLTNGLRVLDDFPGKIDEISLFGQPLLAWAVTQNKPELVDALLKRGANPNIRSVGTEPPIFRAISFRHWSIANRLVDANADLTATNSSGSTPLATLLSNWLDFRQPDPECQQLLTNLLQHGADPFAQLNRSGKKSIVESRLERGSDTVSELLLTNQPSVLRRTPAGDTALHLATIFGRTNEIDFLLKAGFSIDQTNSESLTALQFIAGTGISSKQFFPGVRSIPLVAAPMSVSASSADFLLSHQATLDVFSAAGLSRTNELSTFLKTNSALANARDGLGRTPLHYAMFASNAIPAKLLIDAGSDINATTKKPIRVPGKAPIAASSTPLHLAIFNNSQSLISLLIESKARIAVPDEEGNTPLHLSATQGQINSLKLLLDKSAPLNVTNNSGKTPLWLAVESGASTNVDLLLQAGAKPTVDEKRRTLLHIASERGSTTVLRVLKEHKFSIDVRDAEGDTPFMRAVIALRWDAANFLRKEGADINATNQQGNTALHCILTQQNDLTWHAVERSFSDRWKGRLLGQRNLMGGAARKLLALNLISAPPPPTTTNSSITAWLLTNGASVVVTNKSGETPLHTLCNQRWISYAEEEATKRISMLLKAGAKVDIRCATSPHLTAAELALFLPQLGKLETIRDEQGRTLLHRAVANFGSNFSPRQNELFSLLATNGNLINVQDRNGLTPLHTAFEIARTNPAYDIRFVATQLLTNNPNPNVQDKNGRTPLHILASVRQWDPYYDLPSVLNNPGWDFSIRDHSGQTPLHLWAESNSYNVRELFRHVLTNKALLNITNSDGETLLHVAIQRGRSDLVPVLMEMGCDPTLRNKKDESALYLATTARSGFAQSAVKPPGAENGFFDSISFRDKKSFDLWLDAEPKVSTATNSQGMTALQLATESKLDAFVERLLESSAPVDLLSAIRMGRNEDFERLLSGTKNISAEMLFAAVHADNTAALSALLKAGGDINSVDKAGHSLIFVAARKPEIYDLLKSAGCKETFFDAISLGETDKISAFISADVKLVNIANAQGRSPLICAVVSERKEIVKILLQNGAQVNFLDGRKSSALHFAAAKNLMEIGELLLDAGADPNALDQLGSGPLHIAAAYGRTAFVDLLLRRGANINLQPTLTAGPFCNTPLHVAAQVGWADVVRMLVDHGADRSLKNRRGQTPEQLLLATKPGLYSGSYFFYDSRQIPHPPVSDRDAILKLLQTPPTKD